MTEDRSARQGGLSLKTLAISSASAVVAATVVPLVWEKGTVIATALTPIITAVAAEMLSRPVEKIPTVGVWRQTAGGTAIRERVVTEPDDVVETRVAVAPEPLDEPERRRRINRRYVRAGVITGLLGFLIAAAFVTASELALFGGSVAGERRTSIFGGEAKQAATPEPTAVPEGTPVPDATPTATPTPTVEATATPEATPTAEPTTAPTTEAPPAETPAAAP